MTLKPVAWRSPVKPFGQPGWEYADSEQELIDKGRHDRQPLYTDDPGAMTLHEAMKLWRAHGGDTFGPHAEHVSMKQRDFLGFCVALRAAMIPVKP